MVGLMREGLSPLDAAALFWWARNQLYFEQRLGVTSGFGSFATSGPATVPRKWSRLSLSTSESRCPSRLPPMCVRKPTDADLTDLHPDVDMLCRDMWDSFAGCPEL